MSFTIAICTRNREQVLAQNLRLTIDLIKTTANWHALIVDNSSNTNTRDLLKTSFTKSEQAKITYRRESRPGISYARNKALRSVTSKYLCFIDDDIQIDAKYILQVEKSVKKFPDATLIGGKVLPLNPLPLEKTWLKYLLGASPNFWPYAILNMGDKVITLNPKLTLQTSNLLINTDKLPSSCKFNTSFANQTSKIKIYSGEDWNFVSRVMEKGCKVIYDPRLVVKHQILPYKFTKKYFRWRYFEAGKEIAVRDILEMDHLTLKKTFRETLRQLPFLGRRTLSQYIFNHPQNFGSELQIYFNLGYLYLVREYARGKYAPHKT